MNICVFDQYFSTLGGGERHIGVVIEILLRKHQVTIVHYGAFRHEDIAGKLNLDLSRVTFIDTHTDKNINAIVKHIVQEMQAELFINATHFSQVFIPGIPNITLVFFPKYIYPRAISGGERLKYQFGKWLFDEYDATISLEHFSYPEYLSEGYGQWSEDESFIHVRKSFRLARIYFKNLKNGPAKTNISQVKVDGPVPFTTDDEKIELISAAIAPVKIELYCKTFVPASVDKTSTDNRKLGIFVTRIWLDSFSWRTKLFLSLWDIRGIRHYITRLYIKSRCIAEQLEYGSFLQKNRLLLTNSKYTLGWIKKLYGNKIDPVILYPPTISSKPLYAKPEKQDAIISVGRFFTGDHSKKQLEMIKFFKQMYETCPLARNYTFHICGGTHKEERNQQYLRQCYQSAAGYPIQIHPDIGFDELRELYASAKIFWHAAGLYENEEQAPDKFEHLGFTTIEAMASGCVPVVIGIAGQLEVVQHEVNGFLWNTGEQLIERTYRVIYDESLRQRLSSAAMARAADFNYDHFEQNVASVFHNAGIEV